MHVEEVLTSTREGRQERRYNSPNEGSGKLNISMQLVATSLDLVLNIFMNAPTTTYSKDLKSADERGHAYSCN